MLRFLAIFGFVMALLVQAAPAKAACDGLENQTIAAVAVTIADVTTIAHDEHTPCSDTTHRHVSCACAGHFFVPALASTAPITAHAVIRFDLAKAMLFGRTLQPPVPPPLA